MLTIQARQLLARTCRWEPVKGPARTTPALALPLNMAREPGFQDDVTLLFLRSATTDETDPIFAADTTPPARPTSPWAGAVLVDGKGRTLLELPPWQPAPLGEREPALTDELAIMEGASLLLDRPRQLVADLLELRDMAGPQRLLYTPQAPPESWPLLSYLGVDLFDGVEPALAGAAGVSITWSGRYPGQGSSKTNLLHAEELVKQIRLALTRGRFREFVEASCLPHPNLVAALRIADGDQHQAFANQVPRVAGRNFGAEMRPTTDMAFNRPEVRYYRQRLREYRPPTQAPVLVLFPCSARKPYQLSRSHRLFREALSGIPRRWRIHEVSLTSPLGLVPRELERCYPAAHYDLPVTGRWSAEEREMARQQLRHLLRHGEYTTVLSHLGSQHGLLADMLPSDTVTAGKDQQVSSPQALKKLRREAARAVEGLPPITSQERLGYEVYGLARFQFGDQVATRLTEGCQVKGRVERPRLLDGQGQQLGMVDPRRGFLSLTLAGGRRLVKAGGPRVHIEAFELRGDLFAGGISRIEGEFQPGDEVAVIQSDEVAAVGVARYGSRLMGQMTGGLAVKVRHRASKGDD